LGPRQQRVELARAYADRSQRVGAGVVVIESSRKPFTLVGREIELELVACAPRRIRPGGIVDHRSVAAEIETAFPP
jgi:hypothetical protein